MYFCVFFVSCCTFYKKYFSVDSGFLGTTTPEYNICSGTHLVLCRSGKTSREYNELTYN